MTEKNQATPVRRRKKKKDVKRTIINVVVRTLISILTVAALLVVAVFLIMNLLFNGPSPAARNVLTMSLKEASATKWIPALFLGEKTVSEIENSGKDLFADDIGNNANDDAQTSDPGTVQIDTSNSLNSTSDEWKDYPDGIRIENVSGDTYNAYVMIVRDPSAVYLATSTDKFTTSIPGHRITEQIEIEGAIAGINAGAFNDDGSTSPTVGSVPQDLVVSHGKVVWESGKAPQEGFAGFNKDNVLVVAHSMTAAKAQELNIRDGCCFGPVLIMDGQLNEQVYNINSGYNPRTAIGQRADGAVIMLCIDGRQAGSLGGTYADIINIMVEYGAVNACNLDGGSSSVMLYRDTFGRYGEPGQVQMINNYSLLQEKPRRMPTFFMVRPSEEG